MIRAVNREHGVSPASEKVMLLRLSGLFRPIVGFREMLCVAGKNITNGKQSTKSHMIRSMAAGSGKGRGERNTPHRPSNVWPVSPEICHVPGDHSARDAPRARAGFPREDRFDGGFTLSGAFSALPALAGGWLGFQPRTSADGSRLISVVFASCPSMADGSTATAAATIMRR